MAYELKPIRRVVTGHDDMGRSTVVWDGPAPNVRAPKMGSGRRYTDLWVWNDTVPPLDGTSDDGNLITGNTGQGILDTAPGNATIGFNNISDNDGGGVYLIGRTFKNYTVDNNVISNNGGDGLRILSQGPFSVTVSASFNTIRDNTGRGVNIRAITTSEIKFSVLIDAAYTELAVRTLHTLYDLDK